MASSAPRRNEDVRFRELLANREFSALVAAQLLSGVGDQVGRVAVALAVLAESNSAFYAAAAFAVSYLPAIFGGTLLGPLADRIPRRRLLLLCDLARAAVIAVLALLDPSQSPLWVSFLLLFVAESFTPVYDAAWASMVPEILPDARTYMRGSGLLRVLYLVQQVVGLVIGGAAVAIVSVRYALVIDAATFVVSYVLLLAFVQQRPAGIPGLSGVRSLLRDVREGAADLFGDPARRALVVVAWMSSAYLITPIALGLPYAEQVGRSPTTGTLLMAATLGGAAIGSAFVVRAGPWRQLEAVLPMATGACLVLVLVAFAPPLPVALVLWFVAGALAGFLVPLIGSVALFTDNQRRGRVMGMAAAGYNLIVALVYLVAGWFADVTTPATAVAVAAVVGLGMTGLAALVWPSDALWGEVQRTYAPPSGAADAGAAAD